MKLSPVSFFGNLFRYAANPQCAGSRKHAEIEARDSEASIICSIMEISTAIKTSVPKIHIIFYLGC